MATTTKHRKRSEPPQILVERRAYVHPPAPHESGGEALKRFLLGLGQQLIPLAVMAVIGVIGTQRVTETQVNELKLKVSSDVGEIRKQIEQSEAERRQTALQFQAQGTELTKVGERMSVYLRQQEIINKEISDRLTFIERNQRGQSNANTR